MEKIATLTFHHTTNYGAVLQTFALQNAVQSLGYDCEVIDYRCKLVEENFKIIPFYKFRNPLNYIKYIMKIKSEISKFKTFDDFIARNIKLTKSTYYDKKNLVDLNGQYDKFICGSDQIWNYKITNHDTTFFLDFVSDRKKKIAYAASFGLSEIESLYQERYKNLLNDIGYLSVRENTAAKIIQDLINKNVNVVLDPTLLLTQDNWAELSNKINHSFEPYLLVYELQRSTEMIDYSKKIAKERNLKVIVISANTRNKKKDRAIRYLNNASPQEFIYYMLNCSYVVTNSFHGTAFAINFNKNFTTFLLANFSKVNSRLINILELLDLNNRLFNKVETSLPDIDFSSANDKLEKLRILSINYLKKSIENEELMQI